MHPCIIYYNNKEDFDHLILMYKKYKINLKLFKTDYNAKII